jgi:hypothetical protein
MTTAMMKWATGVVIGLSLFTAGCSEKKSADDTSKSQVEVAPASPPEKSVTDDTLAPSVGSERSPSGVKQEQNPESGRKSPRG